MSVLFVTSTQPRAGKTAVAAALATFLVQTGQEVRYFKPVAPNLEEDADTRFFSEVVLPGREAVSKPAISASLEDLYQGKPSLEEMSKSVNASFARLSQRRGVILVEAPPLLRLDGEVMDVTVGLLAMLDASALLVVPYSPDLSAESVHKAASSIKGHLLGVVINGVTRYRSRDVVGRLVPAIEADGIKVLGAVPEDRVMAAVTVGQVAQELQGRWVLGQNKAGDLIEHFLIGGNVMDWGVGYFARKENKAVVVRGNRPDIQMASLSTPTACLVCTGGSDPIEYVYHESNQRGVPVIVVESGTVETADALSRVVEQATVHHPHKLQRFLDLMTQSIDMESLKEALG